MHFQQSVGLYMWPAYKYFQNYAHEVKQKKKSINYEASGNREMSTDNSYSENPNSVSKLLLFLILNEAQHVSGDTPPIIRSLKLHKQPLVLHTWKVVGRAVVGRCLVAYATGQRPTWCIYSWCIYIYQYLHVSGDYGSIITRNNCVYATLGTYYSVWITGMQVGIPLCIPSCAPSWFYLQA